MKEESKFRRYQNFGPKREALNTTEIEKELYKWHEQQLIDPKIQIEILQKAIRLLEEHYSNGWCDKDPIYQACGLLEGMIVALSHNEQKEYD